VSNSGMTHLSELKRWGAMIFSDFVDYAGGSAPRGAWGDGVFNIDDTPRHIDMCYHNELCYLPTYPRCFLVGSLATPQIGGETMVSDNQATTAALLATEVGQQLKQRRLRYIRNMTDKYSGKLTYKSWQDTFKTEQREDVERYIATTDWQHEWLADGTLRTAYVVDAYEWHEGLQQNLYFSGMVSHASFFDQWPGFNSLDDTDRPFTMTYGDGQAFSNEELQILFDVYNQRSFPARWQHFDLAVLDNLRWTHARPAFQLQEHEQRIMGVAMGMIKQRVGARF
jgi:alpha-ketoglutarate-dependent taurine dioxygenase